MLETVTVIGGVVIAAVFVAMRVVGALGLRRRDAQARNCVSCSEESSCAQAEQPGERLAQLRTPKRRRP